MTTVDNCLRNAKIGDTARVCLTSNGWDLNSRVRWRASKIATANQFTFDIIGYYEGLPVIGSLESDSTTYGFTPNRGNYPSRYKETYILYPSDIKTVKIYKK